MKLLQRIEEYSIYQNNTKKDIAEFILENKLDIHKFSITQIAEKTYSSKSALVRFGKSLGYEGWKDFLHSLIEEIRYEQTHYSDIDPNNPFTNKDSFEDIINNIATIQIESIKDTADRLNIEHLKRAVSMMENSQRIVILGVSPNNLLGEIFRRKMATIGRSVEVIPSGEIGLVTNSLSKNDTAILISYSGNDISREPMNFIPQMKQNGVKLIGITSDGGSFIKQEIDTILEISSRERIYRKISNFSTEESILFILNSLFASFFSKNYIHFYNYKVNNSIKLEQTRVIHQNNLKE